LSFDHLRCFDGSVQINHYRRLLTSSLLALRVGTHARARSKRSSRRSMRQMRASVSLLEAIVEPE
jgi:hypothetical protein